MTTMIATIIHGSHLFGTATENSDVDYKSVVLPEARDILLGRVDASWINQTKEDLRAKNTSEDVDHEHHYLLRFVHLLAEAQPMALEMLFAPERFHVRDPHPVWDTLRDNADRIVSRKAAKFLGYCRNQANTYSMKGERLEMAERVHRHLRGLADQFGGKERLARFIPGIVERFPDEDFVSTEIRTQASGRDLLHLKLFGKLVAETAFLEVARDMLAAKIKEYGERARRAKQAGGHDWKARSHAARIGYEAVELFRTGRIELPLRQAPRLLAIKKGLVSPEEAAEEVAGLVSEVERAEINSGLPEEADLGFLEGIVADAHLEAIVAARPAFAPT